MPHFLRIISILHNMSFKDAPVLAPTFAIEFPMTIETIGCSIGHIKCVVSVVVREETLPAEGQQRGKPTQPLIVLDL